MRSYKKKSDVLISHPELTELKKLGNTEFERKCERIKRCKALQTRQHFSRKTVEYTHKSFYKR